MSFSFGGGWRAGRSPSWVAFFSHYYLLLSSVGFVCSAQLAKIPVTRVLLAASSFRGTRRDPGMGFLVGWAKPGVLRRANNCYRIFHAVSLPCAIFAFLFFQSERGAKRLRWL